MLLYLQGRIHQDIIFAINQWARYLFIPKKSHEEAFKMIRRYLKGTRDKDIVMGPKEVIEIDCYVDAYFAGLWNYEDTHDPTSVKSCSVFYL